MTRRTEEVAVHDGLPLRVSLSPVAIRDMFYDDEEWDLDDVSDADLREAASYALDDPGLWEAVHHAVERGLDRAVDDSPEDAYWFTTGGTISYPINICYRPLI